MGDVSDLKPIVTVCGDGQLARMMQPAAAELDIHLRILASKPDSSAAQVTPDVVLGDYTSLEELRGVAEGADAITFEHEHVPNEHSTALIDAAISLAQTLRAPGISLAVHPDNPRAKGLYEHLGFEHVGSHEDHFVMVKRF